MIILYTHVLSYKSEHSKLIIRTNNNVLIIRTKLIIRTNKCWSINRYKWYKFCNVNESL